MPKKEFPYDQKGKAADSTPWVWMWNVPRSKGTGTPYKVCVRMHQGEAMWGCDCQAGRNGHPSCQHRQRVRYEIVMVPGMLAGLPFHVREMVAPDFAVLPSKSKAVAAPTTSAEMDDGIRAVRII